MYSTYFNIRKATAPVQSRQALEGLDVMASFAIAAKTEASRGTGPLESGQRKATAPVQSRQALEGLDVMASFVIAAKTEASRGTGPLESGQRKATARDGHIFRAISCDEAAERCRSTLVTYNLRIRPPEIRQRKMPEISGPNVSGWNFRAFWNFADGNVTATANGPALLSLSRTTKGTA